MIDDDLFEERDVTGFGTVTLKLRVNLLMDLRPGRFQAATTWRARSRSLDWRAAS